MNINSWRRH